jgi:hypothetical protein
LAGFEDSQGTATRRRVRGIRKQVRARRHWNSKSRKTASCQIASQTQHGWIFALKHSSAGGAAQVQLAFREPLAKTRLG